MSDHQKNWSQTYRQLVDRNVGLLTPQAQDKLRTSKVAVFGMGGVGGTAFELLVRCGIGRFSIVDNDEFEPTNLNRQILAVRDTLGRAKVEVAVERARHISEDVRVDAFDHVDEENVSGILAEVDVVVLAIDSLGPCLIASREARRLGKTLIEGWALPFGNVRAFTAETPTLEQAYGLPTEGRRVADIPEAELRSLGLQSILGLGKIQGIREYYSDETVMQIMQGRISSFAPMVWLTSVLLATETVKVLLDWGQVALGPEFALYDPFRLTIPAIGQDEQAQPTVEACRPGPVKLQRAASKGRTEDWPRK